MSLTTPITKNSAPKNNICVHGAGTGGVNKKGQCRNKKHQRLRIGQSHHDAVLQNPLGGHLLVALERCGKTLAVQDSLNPQIDKKARAHQLDERKKNLGRGDQNAHPEGDSDYLNPHAKSIAPDTDQRTLGAKNHGPSDDKHNTGSRNNDDHQRDKQKRDDRGSVRHRVSLCARSTRL
jgi:hypothetical protein